MLNDFSERAIAVIRSIPKGKVLTYGDVALLAGNHRAARTISWLLNAASEKYGLPWHRVVNSRGAVSLEGEGGELQKQLLCAEGVVFNEKEQIDLSRYRWETRE